MDRHGKSCVGCGCENRGGGSGGEAAATGGRRVQAGGIGAFGIIGVVRSIEAPADSVDVSVAMERKVYTDSSTYRAVISGAWVNLDTIEVWNRHESVS